MPKKGIRRTKTGCSTCKARKVKCDETRPICDRCRKTGRQCVGFSVEARDISAGRSRALLPNQATSNTLATIRPADRPVTGSDGMFLSGIFDFFRMGAAPELGAQNAADFWLRLVLQACHTEEPVWHAAAAFGSLHRIYRDTGLNGALTTGDESSDIAYRQYQHALVSLQSRLARRDSQSMQVALITCVLLTCFDLMCNRYKAALLHLKSGLGILDHCKPKLAEPDPMPDIERKLGNVKIDDDLNEPFEILEVQAIFFGIRRLRHAEWPQASIDNADPLPTDGFRNIEQARKSLEHIVECISSFVVKADDRDATSSEVDVNEELLQEQQLLKLRLQAWHLTAERLFNGHPRSTDLNATSLHVQYWADWILLCTCLDKGREMVFDRHIPDFQRMVDLVEQCMKLNRIPSFNMNHGIIPALYYTAMKCRDPHIRRKAIDLMQSQHWREGMWESFTGAQKGSWLMFEEERDNFPVECAADVPEHARIHQSMLVPRKGEKPVVIFRRKQHESDGRWVMFDAGSHKEFVQGPSDCPAVEPSHWKLFALPSSITRLQSEAESYARDGDKRLQLFSS